MNSPSQSAAMPKSTINPEDGDFYSRRFENRRDTPALSHHATQHIPVRHPLLTTRRMLVRVPTHTTTPSALVVVHQERLNGPSHHSKQVVE